MALGSRGLTRYFRRNSSTRPQYQGIVPIKLFPFLKNGPTLASFSFIFIFSNITILTTKNVEKCPSSIRRWDLNSQPSDYKAPPLTTRPGLLPLKLFPLYGTC